MVTHVASGNRVHRPQVNRIGHGAILAGLVFLITGWGTPTAISEETIAAKLEPAARPAVAALRELRGIQEHHNPKSGRVALPATQTTIAPSNGLRGSQTPGSKDGLTDILTPSDIDRYRQIFSAQEKGQWRTADRLIKKLDNDILMGHVKAQRYLHPTAYRSKYVELSAWLKAYGDHPQAKRIYSLAVKRRPKGYRAPAKPDRSAIRYGSHHKSVKLVPRRKTATERRRVSQVSRRIKQYTRREMPTAALKYLESRSTLNKLTRLEADVQRAEIAASYFFEHKDNKALKLASKVAERNREKVPSADWTAGLAAFRLGKPELSAYHFSKLAASQSAGRKARAGGAYWAARSYLVSGAPERVTAHLKIAAETPASFYGLLALRQLGQTPPLNWTSPAPSQSALIEATSQPDVARAIALAQIGETARADDELRRGHGRVSGELDEALLKVAQDYKLASAELHIAEAMPGRPFHASLFPIPAFVPKGGFAVDPAVIYALMRQESRFKPTAKSRVGARGLMQIMPTTAAYVAKDRSLKWDRARLYDPAFNMELGQDYVDRLLAQVEPKGNLFMMAVAYNGGPTNLKRWYREMSIQDDPLLFIESIPNSESRNYVEHVLANVWLYRYRLGEPVPSLDMVARGDWPIYIPQSERTGRTFQGAPSAQMTAN